MPCVEIEKEKPKVNGIKSPIVHRWKLDQSSKVRARVNNIKLVKVKEIQP